MARNLEPEVNQGKATDKLELRDILQNNSINVNVRKDKERPANRSSLKELKEM